MFTIFSPSDITGEWQKIQHLYLQCPIVIQVIDRQCDQHDVKYYLWSSWGDSSQLSNSKHSLNSFQDKNTAFNRFTQVLYYCTVMVCLYAGQYMSHYGGVGVNGFRNHIQMKNPALCAFSLVPKGNRNVHTNTHKDGVMWVYILHYCSLKS